MRLKTEEEKAEEERKKQMTLGQIQLKKVEKDLMEAQSFLMSTNIEDESATAKITIIACLTRIQAKALVLQQKILDSMEQFT